MTVIAPANTVAPITTPQPITPVVRLRTLGVEGVGFVGVTQDDCRDGRVDDCLDGMNGSAEWCVLNLPLVIDALQRPDLLGFGNRAGLLRA